MLARMTETGFQREFRLPPLVTENSDHLSSQLTECYLFYDISSEADSMGKGSIHLFFSNCAFYNSILDRPTNVKNIIH